MVNITMWGRFLTITLILALFALPVSSSKNQTTKAQGNPAFIREVRSIEAENTGLHNPAGLLFSTKSNAVYAMEAQAKGQPTPADSVLTRLTPFGSRSGAQRISAAVQDPINITYDPLMRRILVLLTPGMQMLAIPENPNGDPDIGKMTRFDSRHLGLEEPQGMTVDPVSGNLYILDQTGPRIIRVEQVAGEGFEQAAISEVNLQAVGLTAPRGLALDPATGHLHVLNPADKRLVELTQSGEVVAIRDLSEFNLGSPQGMVFAPSGDQTDDPGQTSLYIADSSQGTIPAQAGTAASAEALLDGQIVELSLVQPLAAGPISFTSALMRTTDMSVASFSPPSPDPSGLAYIPATNTLVMCDGEVEEVVSGITHFAGANVWQMSLSGGVVRSANISSVAPTVVKMSSEPTGVAWNPANGHYYFSDDNALKIFDLNPGADGLIGTSDDSWTSFSTSTYANNDPEGIAFDSWHNRLFVADGVNQEVYEYTLTGSLINHFDVQTYGVTDPEGVEFNSDRGTLFILSSSSADIIIETTTTGALLQTISVAADNARAAAGMVYGPASDGSGANRFYIVDRGYDNNAYPTLIDGKMMEMTAPSSSVPPTATYTATATQTATPTNTATATLTPTITGTQSPTATSTATYTPTPTFTATNTPTPTTTSAPPSDLIFKDGFESGDLALWSSSVSDGGDLSVSAAAALTGSRGMQVLIDDNNSVYVVDDSPQGETRYRARFYFDPNSIAITKNTSHYIFTAFNTAGTAVLRLEFAYTSRSYQLRANVSIDGSSAYSNTPWIALSDAPHVIEIDWWSASAVGAYNGGVTIWVDGVQKANLNTVDNDTRWIDSIRLGAVSAVKTGTRGTYYLDGFESRRASYIGS